MGTLGLIPGLRHADGHEKVDAGGGLHEIRQCGWKWIAMLDARLGDPTGQPLGDLGDLGDAAPFRNQTRNIDARGEKTAVVQSLDVESDRCFVHGSVSHTVRTASLGAWYAECPLEFYRQRISSRPYPGRHPGCRDG